MTSIREINKYLPTELHFKNSDAPLTKPKVNARLQSFAKKYPLQYSENIHKIGDLGEELAYLSGHNMGINDLHLSNHKEIKNFLDVQDKIISRLPEKEAKRHLISTFNKLQGMTLKNKNNGIVIQALSKARGNPSTATRVTGAVGFAVDMNSEPYPFLIKNSLSNGLSAHEQYASGGQARYAAVQAAVSTSEPGAMGKVLIANTEDLKVVMHDCGTTNGKLFSINDRDLIGRVEAKTNKVLDEQYLKSLKSKGVKNVVARTVETCRAKHGVCALCFGKNSTGQFHNTGHNIGIESSQSLAEKATQLVLSAKHNVAGKESSHIPSGFEATKILLNSTEKFKGKATVATTQGTVTKISKLPTGGYNMTIAGKDHYVIPGISPKVSVGHTVEEGDILTNGIASTKDILLHRGVVEARHYLSNALQKSTGGVIDKRNLEVISRGYLNLIKPKGLNGEHSLMTYDESIGDLKGSNIVNMKVGDRQIVKKFLAEPKLHYSIGHKITKDTISNLRKAGVKEISVSHSKPNYETIFKTYEQRPMNGKSIWQQINYRGIKKGLSQNVTSGDNENLSNIHSDRAQLLLGRL